MSRSKRILEAALKKNPDDLILSSEGENKNSLGEGTSKCEEAYQMQGQTDSNDLITLSDLEESCDDSVVDPNFSPDIISNSDFEDLKSLIRQARMKIRIVEPQNYHDWPKKKREPRSNSDPLKNFQLNSIVQVKFVRGMRQMLYKTSFNEPFVSLDLMMKKFDPSVWPASRNEPRGIKTSKKEEIIKELVKLMPESRKKFWQDLPVNDRSPDLINE